MKEEKESAVSKILIPVAVTVLTALILYFLRIDSSGRKIESTPPEYDKDTVVVANPSPNLGTPTTTQPIKPSGGISSSKNVAKNSSFPFTGLVVNEQGEPVEGVKVICDNQQGFTDAAGKFFIPLQNDPENKDMIVTLLKEGYSSPPYEKRNNETYLFPRK